MVSLLWWLYQSFQAVSYHVISRMKKVKNKGQTIRKDHRVRLYTLSTYDSGTGIIKSVYYRTTVRKRHLPKPKCVLSTTKLDAHRIRSDCW